MRRKSTSEPMTAERAAQIKKLWRDTDWPQHVIAAHINVNPGRVNEVVTGKKFHDVPPAD